MIKKQLGVTLIELMISMVLGLGLIAGIGQLFIQSQKSFRLQRNVSDMTDDATFLLEILAKTILLTGYTDDGDTGSFSSSTTTVLGSSPALKFDGTCIKTPSSITIDLTPTDPTPSVTNTTTIGTTQCEIVKSDGNSLIYRFKLGTSTDTTGALIDDACSSGTRKGFCVLDDFIGTSGLDGNAGDMVSVYIYTKDDTSSSSAIPVLYSRAGINTPATTPTAQPLISDVQKLVFKFGIHVPLTTTTTTINDSTTATLNTTTTTATISESFYYANAGAVTDWTKVSSVRVFVVMRSADDNLTRVKQTYCVSGMLTATSCVDTDESPTTAPDNRVYKVFSKTIYLRTATIK